MGFQKYLQNENGLRIRIRVRVIRNKNEHYVEYNTILIEIAIHR